MTTTVYVGGLAASVRNEEIERLFSFFGDVLVANVFRSATPSMAFAHAHVHMLNAADAQAAVKMLNGTEFHGRLLNVHLILSGRMSSPFH